MEVNRADIPRSVPCRLYIWLSQHLLARYNMRCGVGLVVRSPCIHWAMSSFPCQLASCCAFRESFLTSGRALLLLLDRDVIDDLRVVNSYWVEVLNIWVVPAILKVRFTRLNVHELVGSRRHYGLICSGSTKLGRSFLLKIRTASRLWHLDWRILVGSTCATSSHLFVHHTWVSVRCNYVSSSSLERLRLVWTLRLIVKFNPIWLSVLRRFVHVLGVSEELGALSRVN